MINQGGQLYQILDNKTVTLEINKKLKDLEEINSIIIAGSSWVGKTTIRNILKEVSNENDFFSFPKRVITREQRPNDNLDENSFASSLEELKKNDAMGIIRERELGESKEYYGFIKPPENSTPIYSGNNALVRQKDNLIQTISKDYLGTTLVILVYASDGEHLERNTKREGNYLDSKPLQKLTRLSDSSDSLRNEAHIIVHNHNNQDLVLQKKELENLLNVIKQIKTTP